MVPKSKRGLFVMLLGVMLSGANVMTAPPAEAGGFGKALMSRMLKGGAGAQATRSAKPLTREVLGRDAARDAATTAKALTAPRTVHRYTSIAQARREVRHGLDPNTHMTPNAQHGRPLTPDHAQKRYGLPASPEARETIVLPEGYPVRHNKALGGEPGRGELTSSRRVPPEAIRGYVTLPR